MIDHNILNTKILAPTTSLIKESIDEYVCCPNKQFSGPTIALKTIQRWGYELTHYNTNYCMKQLFIEFGKKTSMHFHVIKHETILVTDGELLLRYKDGKTENIYEVLLPKGCTWVIAPGFQHQLCAPTSNVSLVEASTINDPSDSVRVNM